MVAKEFQRHSSLYAMAVSLDHIIPHSRGGKNELPNFVTACYLCQFGRGNFTLEEVEFNNPLDRAPGVTGWDGLTRLVSFKNAPQSEVRFWDADAALYEKLNKH